MKNENNWTSFINWFAIRPRTSGFMLFSVIAIASLSINIQRNQIQKEDENYFS